MRFLGLAVDIDKHRPASIGPAARPQVFTSDNLREFPDSTVPATPAIKRSSSLLPYFYFMYHLDYLSCALTILSTYLVSRRMWQGWVVASANSVIICIIGFRTAQLGFIPANIFCLALYVYAIYQWKSSPGRTASRAKSASHILRRCGNADRSRSKASTRAVVRGAGIWSSGGSTRVPANDEQSARSSDRVFSRTFPARP
jgi:hypothetical protein